MSFPKENVTENVTEKRTVYILELIKKNDRINTEEIAKNLNVSKRTILRDIEKLKQQNKLKYIGPAKGGHWKIVENQITKIDDEGVNIGMITKK